VVVSNEVRVMGKKLSYAIQFVYKGTYPHEELVKTENYNSIHKEYLLSLRHESKR
jgi:hypothetical protein